MSENHQLLDARKEGRSVLTTTTTTTTMQKEWDEREKTPSNHEHDDEEESQKLSRLRDHSRVAMKAAGLLVVLLLLGWLGSVSPLGTGGARGESARLGARWEAARLGARNRVHRSKVSGGAGGQNGGGVFTVTTAPQHFRAPTASLQHIDENNWAPEPAALGDSWGSIDQVLPRWAQPDIMSALPLPASNGRRRQIPGGVDHREGDWLSPLGEGEEESTAATTAAATTTSATTPSLHPLGAGRERWDVGGGGGGGDGAGAGVKSEQELQEQREVEARKQARRRARQAERDRLRVAQQQQDEEKEANANVGAGGASSASDVVSLPPLEQQKRNHEQKVREREKARERVHKATVAKTAFKPDGIGHAEASLGVDHVKMVDHGGQGVLPDGPAMRTIMRRERARWDREEERRKSNSGSEDATTGAVQEGAVSTLGLLRSGGGEAGKAAKMEKGNALVRPTDPRPSPTFKQEHSPASIRQGFLPMDTRLAVPLNPFHELNPQQHSDMIGVFESYGWSQMVSEAEERFAASDPTLSAAKEAGAAAAKPVPANDPVGKMATIAAAAATAAAAAEGRAKPGAAAAKAVPATVPAGTVAGTAAAKAVPATAQAGAVAGAAAAKPVPVDPAAAAAAAAARAAKAARIEARARRQRAEAAAKANEGKKPKQLALAALGAAAPYDEQDGSGHRRAMGPSELEERVGVSRAAAEMPPLVFLKISECDEESIAGLVRRSALRHGLRGAWSDLTETMGELSDRPGGTPVMLAEDMSLSALRAVPGVEDGVWRDAFKMTFVRDPFRRAVSAFMHRGHEQSGWKVTPENVGAFLRGELGDVAGTFHHDNYQIRRIASPEVVAKLDAGEPLTDDDIRSVLDQYTMVGTVEKRDQSLVLMKLLLPTMELRDISEPPSDVGWGSTDAFGFKRHETVEPADFPRDVRDMLASPAFVDKFVRANGADFRLVELANQRLETRIARRRETFATHLNRYHDLNSRLAERVAQTPEWRAAKAATEQEKTQVTGGTAGFGVDGVDGNAGGVISSDFSATGQGENQPVKKYAAWRSCPLGNEHHCAGRLFRPPPASKSSIMGALVQTIFGGGGGGGGGGDNAPVGSYLLQDQARRHSREGCLYLNEGCFAQTVMNLELDEYTKYAATQAADLVDRSRGVEEGEQGERDKGIEGALGMVSDIIQSEGEHGGGGGGGGGGDEGGGGRGKPRWTAEYAAACHDAAVVPSPRMCEDRDTMGQGLVGKKLAAMARHVYVLCYQEQCSKVCLPKMWAGKATLVDGAKTDQCFGVAHAKHVIRATMSHAAAVAHAAVNRHPSMAMIEADSIFVDPDDDTFRGNNGGGGGGGGRGGGGGGGEGGSVGAFAAALGVTTTEETTNNAPKAETWASDDFKSIRHMIARAGRVAAAATAASGHGAHKVKKMAATLGASPSEQQQQQQDGELGVEEGNKEEGVEEMNQLNNVTSSLEADDPNGDSGLGMTMIRLGYRARNFEVGESSCRAPCGCVRRPGNNFWCTVYSTKCDLRGANAYILIADAYPLVLGPILRKGPGVKSNNVIDHFVLQTIPQQVVATPMLTVQGASAPGTPASNVYPPHAQLKDAHSYLKTCVTGPARRAAGIQNLGLPASVAGSAAAAADDKEI